MTSNTFNTQLELIEYNLRLLENKHVDLNDKNTLDTCFTKYGNKVFKVRSSLKSILKFSKSLKCDSTISG